MKKTKFIMLSFLTFFTILFTSCEELFGVEDEDDFVVESVACGDYVGPSNIDNQYDYQCQAAYVYYCNGQTEALASQCAYYKQLQQQLNLPDCNYCD